MSAGKKLGLGLVIALALIVIALLIIPHFINLDSLKPEIERQAGKFLRRQLSFQGIRLQFLPSFGVELSGLKIQERPGFGEEPFLEVGSIEVKISLLKLLRNQIDVKRIVVIKPRISVSRNKSGELSVSDLYKKSREKEAPEKVEKETEAIKVADRRISIGAIQVRDGTFNFADYRAPSGKQSFSAQVDNMEMLANIEENKYLVKPSRVSVGKSVFDFSGEMTGEHYQFKFGSTNLDLAELSRIIYPLRKFIEDKKIILTGTGILSGILSSGSPAILQASMDLKNAEFRYPGVLQKPAGDKFFIYLDARQIPSGYSIENLLLEFSAGEFTGKGSLTKNYDLDLSLYGKGISMDEFSRMVEPLSGYSLKGKMDFAGKLSGRLSQAQLLNVIIEQLLLSGPDIDLGLKGSVSDLTAPRIRVDVQGKKLDLAGLMKSNKRKSASETAPSAKSEKQDRAKDGKKEPGFIEKIDLEGNLNLAQVSYQNYLVQNFQSPVMMKEAVLSFANASFNVFNGRASGPLKIDLSRKKPHYQGNISLSGIEIPVALKGFSKMADTISGNFDCNLEFSGRGSSWQEIKPKLTGQGRAILKNGSLKTFNLVGGLLGDWANSREVKNLLKSNLGKSQWQNLKETRFDSAEFNLEIKDGFVQVKDLAMAIPGGRLSAKGKWDFGYRVDFSGELWMDDEASKQIAKELGLSQELTRYLFQNGKNLWLPFNVKGTYPSLTPGLDSDKYTKKLGKNLIDEFGKQGGKGLKQLLEKLQP